LFGNEQVIGADGTLELARVLATMDSFLFRRAAGGENLYGAWHFMSMALIAYTNTLRTASGLVVVPA